MYWRDQARSCVERQPNAERPKAPESCDLGAFVLPFNQLRRFRPRIIAAFGLLQRRCKQLFSQTDGRAAVNVETTLILFVECKHGFKQRPLLKG
jgi:hypothetical protein